MIATGALTVRRLPSQGSNAIVALDYPVAVPEQDLTFRPQSASGGTMTYTTGGGTRTVRSSTSAAFTLPGAAGQTVAIAAGAARDRYGNANGQAATLAP